MVWLVVVVVIKALLGQEERSGGRQCVGEAGDEAKKRRLTSWAAATLPKGL